MDWSGFQNWLSTSPILLIALELFAAMSVAAVLGVALGLQHKRHKPVPEEDDGGEGYIVSAVLGLLALLMGFTFSLAVDRFDARRSLVVQEANAIGTTYLRAQLLPEPHRARMSNLLVRYTDNRIALAKAPRPDLLATNDVLITDIWTATTASFDSIKNLDFSSAYIDAVNTLINMDAARKAARGARVPAAVFAVLFVYLITTAGVLGYVLRGLGGRLAAGFLLSLLTLSLALIIDIDRPTAGGILESQAPMERLRATLAANPPAVFDRWRGQPAGR